MQAELLSISFEYLDMDQHSSDAVDFLLLLSVRLQDEKSDPKLRRYLNIVNRMIDQLKLNSSQLEVILYSIGRLLEQVNVFVLPVLVSLITVRIHFYYLLLNTQTHRYPSLSENPRQIAVLLINLELYPGPGHSMVLQTVSVYSTRNVSGL